MAVIGVGGVLQDSGGGHDWLLHVHQQQQWGGVRRALGVPQVCLLPLDWLKGPRQERRGVVGFGEKEREKSICSSASRSAVDRVRLPGAGE